MVKSQSSRVGNSPRGWMSAMVAAHTASTIATSSQSRWRVTPVAYNRIKLMNIADRQLAIWLSLLTFATYAYFHAGGGWNQNSQFDLTRAIVERHTFAIDAFTRNTGDVARHGRHVYTNKSPGLSIVGAVPYSILHAFEKDPDDPLTLALNHYTGTILIVALLGALVPAILYRLGRDHGLSATWSATVAISVGLATQLLPYATF